MKLKFSTCIIFGLLCFTVMAQGENASIIKTEKPDGWIIKTNQSAYQIIVIGGSVKQVYYGAKEQADFIQKNAAWFENIDEVPVRGGFPFNTPAIEVVFPDHVSDAELKFVSGEIINIDGRQALKIIQKDKVYPLQIVSYIRVLPEYDILEKWIEVKNTSKNESIKVENLMSGSIVLPADEYILTQLSGKGWSEFQPYQSLLTPGLKLIQNKTFKSTSNASWFQIRPESSNKEENGPTWFGSLHYSGNWQLAFDKTFNSTVQILGGINFWDTELNLKPGSGFQTPKFSVGYTTNGSEGVSSRLGAYVRNEILPAEHRYDMRPVLFNSWYATTDKLNEDQQVELAKIAAGLGVELFVIDAGWYKVNNKFWGGIGNWDVDSVKFPHGLTSLIKKVNDLGMKFGIWVEPENIHVSSDAYLQHPDWALKYSHWDPTHGRPTLNLAKEEVYKHLLETLSKLLTENNIDFVKWDQNNFFGSPSWVNAPADIQKEVRIRYIQNLYRLVDELKKRFPKVMFESCSSGGGRIDLGMMSRMDQAWVSDNTTAIDRLFIQYGYLSAMPANTMVSWVIENQTPPTSLNYKFDVAMSGVLGVGYDIRKWTANDIEIAKNKIKLYKEIRPLIQQGVTHRLVSPFENNRCALQYNSSDGKSAVLLCYNLALYLPGSQFINRGSNIVKLKGLNAEKQYLIKRANDDKDNGVVYQGDFLMNIGISWPIKEIFESQIMVINQVE